MIKSLSHFLSFPLLICFACIRKSHWSGIIEEVVHKCHMTHKSFFKEFLTYFKLPCELHFLINDMFMELLSIKDLLTLNHLVSWMMTQNE